MSVDRSDAAVTAAVGGLNGAIGGPGDIGGITDTGITGGIGIVIGGDPART